MKEVKKDTNEYEGPPIVMDLVLAYKQWYGIHQHLPKLYRITISHQMLTTLSNCIEHAVIANFAKKNSMELEFGKESLLQLRGKIELVKAYALISWEMKFISHGFYGQFSERIENISKQAAMWHNWFISKYK
ncbi:MAG: four helix bundle protein [Candidatus Pacearchaeota archaeon]